MSAVFHRHTKIEPPIAVEGDGCYVVDASGKRYLDASGGAAVSCLGHSDPDVRAALHSQLDRLAYAHTGFFTSEPAEALARHLVDRAPEGIEKVYFVSGGSEAVEAALKLARQFYIETERPERRHVIARWQSYHGNTLAALAVGGNRWRREPFEPLMIPTHHISPCFAYRFKAPGESEEAYGLRVADELEAKIKELGEDSVFAFIAEPVVGATSGAVPAAPGYFQRIREICDKYDVQLILDEVMCGMGRTGSLYACEQEDVRPDLIVIAKGLGAGYQPIGAVLASGRIFDAIRDGSGFFQHGHTYMGHPMATAAGLAVQRKIEADNLLDKVIEMGGYLDDALHERFGNHPHVGDIRGRGLFRAIEFVSERSEKTPFDPGLKVHARVKAEAMSRGLMCYPMGGTIDGVVGDHVLLAPPFIVSNGEIEEIADKLGSAVEAVLEVVGAQTI
jgi:adenosylmethionine-8-amino-7-oxononanoate aminotransferase